MTEMRDISRSLFLSEKLKPTHSFLFKWMLFTLMWNTYAWSTIRNQIYLSNWTIWSRRLLLNEQCMKTAFKNTYFWRLSEDGREKRGLTRKTDEGVQLLHKVKPTSEGVISSPERQVFWGVSLRETVQDTVFLWGFVCVPFTVVCRRKH